MQFGEVVEAGSYRNGQDDKWDMEMYRMRSCFKSQAVKGKSPGLMLQREHWVEH